MSKKITPATKRAFLFGGMTLLGTIAISTPFVLTAFVFNHTSYKTNLLNTIDRNKKLVVENNYQYTPINDKDVQVTTLSGNFVPNKYEFQPNLDGILVPVVGQITQPNGYTYLENSKATEIHPNEYSAIELSPAIKDSINKVSDTEVIKLRINQKEVYQYRDPFTGIVFRDWPYKAVNGQNKYFFKDKLPDLAREFKRKVPFGPEVLDLNTININYGDLNSTIHGLYQPQSRNIFINGQDVQNKELDTYDIIAAIMPTLFHEYIHHWTNTYVDWNLNLKNISEQEFPGFFNQNITKEQRVIYNPLNIESPNSQGTQQSWNYQFTNNFIKLLNYDFNERKVLNPGILDQFQITKERLSNYLFENFTLKQLFDIANFNQLQAREQYKTADNKDKVFLTDGFQLFGVSIPQITYLYSLTELIPREYTKFAFESYYQIDEPKTNLFQGSSETRFAENWFGSYELVPTSPTNNQQFSVKNFTPSANNQDWSRVFLNGYSNPNRTGMYILNSAVYPNSVFPLVDYLYLNQNNEVQHLSEERAKNRSVELYQNFLEAMGYGKSVAQIYKNKANSKFNTPDIKISGYLKDKKYTGIVFLDEQNKVYAKSDLVYNPIFNFFGHYDFDQGARLYDQKTLQQTPARVKQLENRLYPKEKFYSYFTKDYVTVKNNTTIKFWVDLNHDGVVQANEIDNSFSPSIPNSRYVATYRDTSNEPRIDVVAFAKRNSNGHDIVLHNIETIN